MIRVLLVEDNEGDAVLAERALKAAVGLETELFHVRTLEHAIEEAVTDPPDVILLDLGLPDSRGPDTFHALQHEADDIPVVVLTGENDDRLGTHLVHCGAQDFLPKDQLDPAVLARSIQFAIERQRAAQARREAAARAAEIDRLNRLDEFKTRIFNTASHELKTPLTPLKVQVHMLRHGTLGQLDARQAQAVEVLHRNLQRLEALVHDMLDVAWLEREDWHIVPEERSLDGTVGEIASDMAEVAACHDITLEQSLESGTTLRIDPLRIGQVVSNLLDNAIKYTPEGGRITVRTSIAGTHAAIEVADTGTGLEPHEMDVVFEPFSQARDALHPATASSGLGLYICQGIVEAHGGSILVESDGRGLGATFTVRLPLALATDGGGPDDAQPTYDLADGPARA